MQAAYLYFNAVLYVVFAVLCTIASGRTSNGLGYLALSNGGHSEYLVIYGGLQLGLAAIFWIAARDPAYGRLGVLLAIALYAPIVLYRVVTMVRFWPVAALTQATGALELVLLLAAGWLFYARTP